jgi:hypothetical protein
VQREEAEKLQYVGGLNTIYRIRKDYKAEERRLWTLDTYKSANCASGAV